jgi:hypothetical protein
MKMTATALQWLVRLAGLLQIILGVLFWIGNALALIPLHMLVGSLLVLALWVLAGMAAFAHVNRGRVALAFVWGIIVVALGMTQNGILPGSFHWIVQAVHLLVGLAAMGQAEGLAVRIKGTQTLVPQA